MLKGQLGRRPQHPLPVAVLSELGKSGGPEIKAYFSRDQLILERELQRSGRSRVNREDGQGSESLKRHEIFAATPQLNVRLYPKAKGSAASLYGDPLPRGCINRSPFLLSAEIRLPVTQFFPLAKPSLFHSVTYLFPADRRYVALNFFVVFYTTLSNDSHSLPSPFSDAAEVHCLGAPGNVSTFHHLVALQISKDS